MNNESMSLAEFKDSIRIDLWNDSLEEIKQEYRRLVADTINGFVEKQYITAYFMSNHFVQILDDLDSLGEGMVDRVFEQVNKIKDTKVAHDLAVSSAGIIECIGVEGYDKVVKIVHALTGTNWEMYTDFARKSKGIAKGLRILEKRRNLEEMSYVNKVFDNVERLAEKDALIAEHLALESVSILEEYGEWYDEIVDVTIKLSGDAEAANRFLDSYFDLVNAVCSINEEHVPLFLEYMGKIAEIDEYTALRLGFNSYPFLDNTSVLGEDYIRLVYDSIEKLAGEDCSEALKLATKASDVIEKYGLKKELSTDLFLIEFVYDHKSANAVRAVIDFDNPQVEKEYGKKYGSFF